MSNLDYLLWLNRMVGRTRADATYHPGRHVDGWVVSQRCVGVGCHACWPTCYMVWHVTLYDAVLVRRAPPWLTRAQRCHGLWISPPRLAAGGTSPGANTDSRRATTSSTSTTRPASLLTISLKVSPSSRVYAPMSTRIYVWLICRACVAVAKVLHLLLSDNAHCGVAAVCSAKLPGACVITLLLLVITPSRSTHHFARRKNTLTISRASTSGHQTSVSPSSSTTRPSWLVRTQPGQEGV